MPERTAVAAGGVFTAATTWSPEGIPTAEDDLIINATCTGTVTVSAAAKCRSLDTTGYKGKLKIEKTLSVGGATVNGSNLAIRLGAETLVEMVGVGVISLVCSKAAATQEVFCNGASFGAFKVSAGATVKVKFGDQFLVTGALELTKGIIEVGASGWKTGGFSSEGELTRELKMGSGTLKVNGTWGTNGANLTITKETSTLEFTGTANMTDASSFSYNVVTLAAAASSVGLGKGNPTIATLNVNAPVVEFREGSTVTVTTLATTATSEAKIKVKSGTKGVKYAIKATARQTITCWELEDCEALGGINFIDSGGVDLGGNVNWTFEGGAETKTVTVAVHGAGAGSTVAAKVGLASASVTGAGLAKAASLKVAIPSALVHGAGNATATSLKVASATALVHGAGNATVTLTPSGEVKIVTALVHGAGRSTALVVHVGLATGRVTGAGAAKASFSKIARPTASVSGAGAASVSTRKIAKVAANVTGAGRATVTLTGPEGQNGRIALVSYPGARISCTSKPGARIAVASRPSARIATED